MRQIAAIVGTTGVGKSQLAVELCKALRGQVINADAMQVYKGLDVITNKMPVHERQNIRHHLMDFLDPEEEYRVTEFHRDATERIEQICSENELPVIVGGTNYYVQSLLWHDTLISKNESLERQASPEPSAELDALDTTELYRRLQQVDPIMANRWHPSDRRKILRSLQIYHETGRPQSEILKEVQEQHEEHGARPRFKSLIFWLYAEQPVLKKRLEDRVDKMITEGLFDEIQSLRKRVIEGSVKQPGKVLDQYQRGLWQAIGYKEFDPYFTAMEKGETDGLEKIKNECLERMKSATVRYAKRQTKWIQSKLLPTVWNSKDVHIYLLDATDLNAWNDSVRDRAINVAKAFLNNSPLPDPMSLSNNAAKLLSKPDKPIDTSEARTFKWKKHVCPVCKTDTGEPAVLNGDLEWAQHISGRWHRKSLKRLKNEENMRKRTRNNEAQQANDAVV